MPEWSKGLRSGRNVFELVGSNPTADILLHFTRPVNASNTTSQSTLHPHSPGSITLPYHYTNGHPLASTRSLLHLSTKHTIRTQHTIHDHPILIAMRRLLTHNLDGWCSSLPVCLFAAFAPSVQFAPYRVVSCRVMSCRVVSQRQHEQSHWLAFLLVSQICAWVHLKPGVG